MNPKIREGATLGEVVAAMPRTVPRADARRAELSKPEQWDLLINQLVNQLDAVLREIRPDIDRQPRLLALRERACMRLARRTDASLDCLVRGAGCSAAKYSSSHALLTAMICQLARPLLGWPAEQAGSLTSAALTMNLSMQRLQDQMALGMITPTLAERALIDCHLQAGAECLQASGLRDVVCIEVVRLHHQAGPVEQALAALGSVLQMSRLLRRVEIYAAKVSCRALRQAMSSVQAAREAFLGAQGTPDEVGGAMLRAVGLYAPGSFVELVSAEVGIVLAHGRRSNLPVVASLVSTAGEAMMESTLRDTIERRHAVNGALRPEAVRVRPPTNQRLAMR